MNVEQQKTRKGAISDMKILCIGSHSENTRKTGCVQSGTVGKHGAFSRFSQCFPTSTRKTAPGLPSGRQGKHQENHISLIVFTSKGLSGWREAGWLCAYVINDELKIISANYLNRYTIMISQKSVTQITSPCLPDGFSKGSGWKYSFYWFGIRSHWFVIGFQLIS